MLLLLLLMMMMMMTAHLYAPLDGVPVGLLEEPGVCVGVPHCITRLERYS